jgi:salicylate hydroxylase
LEKTGAVAIEGTSIRQGATDEELACASYAGQVQRFEAPIWVSASPCQKSWLPLTNLPKTCHRADLHKCLAKSATEAGINLILGVEVTQVNFKETALKYKKRKTSEPESDWLEYDLIVGADGVKSNVRRQMMALHGEVDEAQDTVSRC